MSFHRRALIGSILVCLKEGATIKKIVENTGVSDSSVRRYVATWKRLGVVYRESYVRGGSQRWEAVWRLRYDNEADAKPPKPIENAKVCAAYKKRKKAKTMGVWGGLML